MLRLLSAGFLAFALVFLWRTWVRTAARPPSRKSAIANTLTMFAVSALAVGWLEVAAIWFRQSVQNRFAFWALNAAWLTPVVYLLLFALPAALLVLVASTRSRWVPPQLPAFVFTLLAVGSLSYSFPRVSPYAMTILALGAAVQMGRLTTTKPERAYTWARRGLVALASLTAVAFLVERSTSYERGQGTLLAEAGNRAPNVLFLILDTVRAESLGFYGYERNTTPRLDEFVARGTVFDWAISPSPWTLGTHASVFTGRWGHELTAGNRTPLDASFPTVAEAFRDVGYPTAHIVANARYAGRETGVARGADYIDDYQGTGEPLLSHAWLSQTFGMQAVAKSGSAGELLRALLGFSPWAPFQREIRRRSAQEINDSFLTWLDSGEGSFYAFLNYFDAHRPYEPPSPYREEFLAGTTHESVGLYDGTIAALDHEIGRLLDELEARGQLENTIVIVTSDHGEQVQDRGRTGHSDRLYSQVVRVPLAIVAPGRAPAGERVTEVVSLRDLPATLVDLAGLEGTASFPGASLAGFWEDSRGSDEWVLAELSNSADAPPDRLVVTGDFQSKSLFNHRFHYIWRLARDTVTGTFDRPIEELFDYRADPREMENLVGNVLFADTVLEMRRELISRFPIDGTDLFPTIPEQSGPATPPSVTAEQGGAP